MYRFKEYKDMLHHIADILKIGSINIGALLGVQLLDIEGVLKNVVLFATLVYTVIKIVQALQVWKKKKEIKKEEK